MSTLSKDRKLPDMGCLRIDTSSNCFTDEKGKFQTGLLTPISAACDGRRSSMASSGWSFASQAVEAVSQPSSATSTRSSQEPMTPPPHCLHTDMSFLSSSSSFEDSGLLPETDDVKRSLIYPQEHFFGSPVYPVEFDSRVHWVGMEDRIESQRLRVPFVGMDRMMPAFVDLPAAFRTGIVHSQHGIPSYSVEAETFRNNQLQDQRYDHYSTFGHVEVQPYAVDSNIAIQDGPPLPTLTSKFWQTDRIQIDSCIVPSDIDMDCHNQVYSMPVQNEQDVTLSHCGSVQALNGDEVFRFSNSVQQSDSHDETFQIKSENDSSMEQPSTSDGNGRKSGKARRSSTRTKRKQKNQLADEYIGTLHGSAVGVRHVRLAEKQTKHICEYVDQNNKVCGKSFNRVEHLTRHVVTHSGETPYQCVLRHGKLNCSKNFGRRDNLRDHYKTHLAWAKAARNPRVEFNLLYQTLRELEEAGEAEKTINTLEKWRALGKHLKKESSSR